MSTRADNKISTPPASTVTSDWTEAVREAGARVFEMDQQEQTIPAVEFRDISFSFDDEKVLDRLSFKVMKGEIKIILSGSAGGKTTILKLILRLLEPDEGHVLIDREDLQKYAESQLTPVRDKLGMVFQEAGLFDSLSVYDNVAYRLHEEDVPGQDA